jgi:hypothetical protein
MALRLGGYAPAPYVAAVLAASGLVYLGSFALVGVADQLRYLHPVMVLAVLAAPLAVAALVAGPDPAAAPQARTAAA